MRSHPLADLFPLMEGADFDALVADIKANGQREPIVIFEGAILDGRNRWHACKEAGIEPETKEYRGNDPLAYVISLNIKRRHLNESQRAMVAAKIATLRKGVRSDAAIAASIPTQNDAAKILNVSVDSIQRARTVLDRGTPELQRAVKQGHLAVSAAAQAAKFTPERQQQVAREAVSGVISDALTKAEARAVARSAPVEIIKPRIADGGTVEDLHALVASGFRAGALLIDCPWKFATWSHVGLAGDSSQIVRNQRKQAAPYATMSFEELSALPVGELAADDCVLFLWVVRSHLPEAFEHIRHWGFDFKSVAFVWFKGEYDDTDNPIVRMGTGIWTRTGSEQCWLATRGNPRPQHHDVREVIAEKRREHSRKPDCTHERIERLVAGPYLELFARCERPNWKTWGNEVAPPNPNGSCIGADFSFGSGADPSLTLPAPTRVTLGSSMPLPRAE